MIKKIFLGLFLFSIFIFGNSVSAVNHEIGLNSFNSTVDNNFSITPLKGGAGITNKLGLSKGLFAFSEKRLFWWDKNGRPYIYVSSGVQGFVNKYSLCNLLSGVNSVLTNCTYYTIGGDYYTIFTDFFNNVNAGDYFHYVVSSENTNMVLCWSSSVKNKTLCLGKNSNFGNLTGSLGYEGLNFSNINTSLFGYAPGQGQYGSGGGGIITGSSQEVVNSNVTGNVTYFTCTNSKALSYYKVQGYNNNLCYSSYGNNNDIYTSPGSVSDFALTGLDISDVWLDTAGYRRYGNTGTGLPYNDWFQYWRKSFEVYNNSYNSSGTVSNPFVGVPVSLFTLFGNVYSYGLAYNNQSIIEYCDLLLFTNPNDPYEGILGDLPCNYSAIDILADTIGVHADSGEVVKGSSWEGILNRPGYHLDLGRNSGSVSSGNSSGLSYFGDGKSFINNSFNLLSDSFRFPDRDSNGIIPSYILVFMFALILFRFISH